MAEHLLGEPEVPAAGDDGSPSEVPEVVEPLAREADAPKVPLLGMGDGRAGKWPSGRGREDEEVALPLTTLGELLFRLSATMLAKLDHDERRKRHHPRLGRLRLRQHVLAIAALEHVAHHENGGVEIDLIPTRLHSGARDHPSGPGDIADGAVSQPPSRQNDPVLSLSSRACVRASGHILGIRRHPPRDSDGPQSRGSDPSVRGQRAIADGCIPLRSWTSL
jgi:hypothetical protein